MEDYYLPISAACQESLNTNILSHLDYLEKIDPFSPRNLSYSAGLKRQTHACKVLIRCKDKNTTINLLRQKQVDKILSPLQGARLVMVFSGMGQQWWAMSRQLLDCDEDFVSDIKHVASVLQQYDANLDIFSHLQQAEDNSQINSTAVAQCSIFAMQIGLYNWFTRRGVTPEAVVGHSVGEAAAAYVSGSLTLEDAVRVVYVRSKLQATTAGIGGMLAVGLSASAVTNYLAADDDVSIAAINSPTAVTLAGNTAHLERLEQAFKANNIFAKFLKVEVAYHSPTMDAILVELKSSLADIKPQKTNINLYSTVTGSEINGESIDGQYWCKNVRETVQFKAVVEQLLADTYNVFLEIAAHPVLTTSINEVMNAQQSTAHVLNTLRRKGNDIELLENNYEKLFQLGVDIKWQVFFDGSEKFIKLPPYSWNKQPYWNESFASKLHRLGDNTAHPLLGSRLIDVAVPTWQSQIDLEQLTYLGDHKVGPDIYFPAAGFIEVALNAAKEHLATEEINLTNTLILAPLVLTSEKISLLQTVINDAQISIYSKHLDQENWQHHASFNFAKIDNIAIEKKDISQIKSDLQSSLALENIYLKLADKGLNYGKEFQKITALHKSSKRIVSKITQTDVLGYLTHPATLDACIHSCILADFAGTYLPVTFGNIKLYQALHARELYTQVAIVNITHKYAVFDVNITNDTGEVLIGVDRLTCKYQTGSRQSDDINDYSYEYLWLGKPLPHVQDTSADLPNPRVIASNLESDIHALSKHHNTNEYYTHIAPVLDDLAIKYILQAFINLGFNFDKGKQITKNQLLNDLAIAEKYYKFFQLCLDILQVQQIIQCDTDLITVLKTITDVDIASCTQHIASNIASYISDFLLLNKAGEKLAKIFANAINPHELLFDAESSLMEEFYRSSFASYINQNNIAKAVDYIVQNTSSYKKFKILEIGAGTGATTSAVIKSLPPARVEYTYTDISQYFLTAAEKKFSDHRFFNYKILDISKSISEQGFNLHSYDIVIASGVIHATENLDTSLNNIKNLLSNNGILLLLEQTNTPHYFDVMLGCLDGWWLFNDSWRTNRPLISQTQWQSVLENNNYTDIHYFSDNGENSVHSLIVARNNLTNEAKEQQYLSPSKELKQRQWLIFMPEDASLVKTLLSSLIEQGVNPIQVNFSNRFEKFNAHSYSIVESKLDDYTRLLDELHTSPIIINCSAMQQFGSDLTTAEIASITTSISMRFTFLMQAFISQQWSESPQHFIITNSLYTFADPEDINISATPIIGLARVAMNELPNATTKLIDVSYNATADEQTTVLEEIYSQTELVEDEVCIRNNTRYVHRLSKTNYHNALTETQNYHLDTKDKLNFVATDRAVLEDWQIEVYVHASALNANDIAVMRGAVNHDSLGIEFSGVVVRIGSQVQDYKVGDSVFGWAENTFSKFVLVTSATIALKPDCLSFYQAASSPLAFITAIHCLERVAKLRPSINILINNATSPYGLAAIALAKTANARIFACANTADQQDYLAALGITNIYKSEGEYLSEQVKQITDGQVLDIIFDYTSAISSCVKLLPTLGGFIFDISTSTTRDSVNVLELAPSVQYYKFSTVDLCRQQPSQIQSMLQDCSNNLASKTGCHIPYSLTSLANLDMKVHSIPSVGIRVFDHLSQDIVCQPGTVYNLNRQASYLITGGLSGIGLAMAQKLANQGASELILLGRRGLKTPNIAPAIRAIEATGARVYVEAVDISDYDAMKQLFAKIKQNNLPLKGIIHSAVVFNDSMLANLTVQKLENSFKPKLLGAWNLHLLSMHLDLDYFINFSSITAVYGNVGQANYVASNQFLSNLLLLRKTKNLTLSNMLLTNVLDVGYAKENAKIQERFIDQGLYGIDIDTTQTVFNFMLHKRNIDCVSGNLDWNILKNHIPIISKSNRFTNLLVDDVSLNQSSKNLDEVLHNTELLTQSITKILSQVLKLEGKFIDSNTAVYNFGLDSLLTTEFNLAIQQALGIEINKIIAIHGSLTIDNIVQAISNSVSKSSDQATQHNNAGLIIKFNNNPKTKMNLFCLPYLAGGISAFKNWPIDPSIQICAVDLPHRRYNIGDFTFNSVVKDIAESMVTDCNKPFAIYGHSMGGFLAIAVAEYLTKKYNLVAQNIFVASTFPIEVHIELSKLLQNNLVISEQLATAFTRSIEQVLYGGSINLNGMEKIVQADLSLLQSCMDYSYADSRNFPITLLAAKQDNIAPPDVLFNSWQNTLQQDMHCKTIDGGHLFIHEKLAINTLCRYLARTLLTNNDAIGIGQHTSLDYESLSNKLI